MKTSNTRAIRLGLLAAAMTLLGASPALADAFSEYQTNGKNYTFNLPTIAGGWFDAVAGFPPGAPSIGTYALAGRLLVANNNTLYLQKNYGSSVWIPVATLGTTVMDPSFVAISPDGTRIALGVGYGQQMLFFKASLLSTTSPPNLMTAAGVTRVTADYYSGAWHSNTTFVFNGGASIGGTYTSGVLAIKLAATPANPTVSVGPFAVINAIPGASAGIAFDATGRLVTGIGYLTSPTNRTGELRVWSAGNVTTALASNGSTVYAYGGTQGKLLAANVLSADALGFDGDNNLHVGGGDAFGVGGANENGYAAVIKASVVSGAVGGGSPVNESLSTQYRELIVDACEDDSSTSPIVVVPGTKALGVVWNPSGNGGFCYAAGSAQDYWETGVTPKITLMFPNAAPDADGDGIPDGADNAYLTANTNQRDTDGDGFGNVADCDLNNDGVVNATDQSLLNARKSPAPYNADADFNGDGVVNAADQTIFNARNGQSAPFY